MVELLSQISGFWIICWLVFVGLVVLIVIWQNEKTFPGSLSTWWVKRLKLTTGTSWASINTAKEEEGNNEWKAIHHDHTAFDTNVRSHNHFQRIRRRSFVLVFFAAGKVVCPEPELFRHLVYVWPLVINLT
jgi:hypothetical protein